MSNFILLRLRYNIIDDFCSPFAFNIFSSNLHHSLVLRLEARTKRKQKLNKVINIFQFESKRLLLIIEICSKAFSETRMKFCLFPRRFLSRFWENKLRQFNQLEACLVVCAQNRLFDCLTKSPRSDFLLFTQSCTFTFRVTNEITVKSLRCEKKLHFQEQRCTHNTHTLHNI